MYIGRSPLASVFYRFGTGKAFYDAPGGRIEGDVSLKRQFEIRDGSLEYFFDADAQVQDEFLRKLLSQNASQTFEKIMQGVLPQGGTQDRNQQMETLMKSQDEETSRLIRSTLEFKGSAEFAQILRRFVADIPKRHIEFSDAQYDGKCLKGK